MAPSKTDEASHAVTNGDSGNENQENSHQISGEDNPKNNYDSKDESSPGKIFIGGLSRETTTDTFTKYFSKYGELTDSVIMRDRITGNPRGFGFVTYADPSVVDKVIKDKHVIDGKLVEIKRTIPRGNVPSKGPKTKKIFVGGIPTTMTEDEFRDHFSKYGKVVEHQIMLDHSTGRSRGFGFITFDSESSVEEILSQGRMHDLAGKKVEIKKAEPKKPLPDSEPAYGMDSRPPYHSGGRGGYGELYGGLGAGGYSSSYRTGAYSGRPGGYGTYGGPDYGSSYGGYGSGSLGSYRGDSGGYGSRYGTYSGGYGGYGSGMVGGYGDSDSFVGGYAGSSYASGYDSGLGSGYGSSAGFGSRGYGGGSSGRYHPYAR